MARYYQRPQAPIVDLTPKVPIEFYSNLINQAQQNLNQANATGAAFMTDAYNQKFVDQAARDKAMALGQAPIEQALDRDFVTPAAMAKAVTQASAAMADWKNVNTKHVEEVKREQELRDRLGANYIGNSVKNMSLIDPATGQFIKPADVKLIASNREDLVQALAKDNAGRADLKREIEGGWKTILGGKAFEKRNTTVTGLTEKERIAEFVNNQQMAKQYLAQMPEFAAAIAASGVDPVEYMTKEIDQWSKQLVRGETIDSKYLDNPDYKPGAGPITTFGNGVSLKSMQSRQEGDKSVQELLANARGNVSGFSLANPFNYENAKGSLQTAYNTVPKVSAAASFLGPGAPIAGIIGAGVAGLADLVTDYNNPQEREQIKRQAIRELEKKYPLLAKRFTTGGKDITIANSLDAIKNPDEYRGSLDEAAFLDAVEQFSNDPTYFNNVVDYQDEKINAGIKRRIITTINTGGNNSAMAIDEDGKKVKLSSLKLEDSDMQGAQLIDNGNVIVRVDGKQYIINTTDKNNAGLGVFNTVEEPMIRFASSLDKEQFKYFDKPKNLGDITTVKDFIRDESGRAITNAKGDYVYYHPRYEIITDPSTLENVVIKTYLDINTLKPHYVGNNQPYQEIMTLGEAKAEMFDFIGASVKQEDDTNN